MSASGVLRSLARRALSPGEAEESVPLRALVLAAGWWAALALYLSGASPRQVLLGGLLALAGHGFSWRFRHVTTPLRSAAVALALVVVGVLTRDSVLAATGGDWLPVATVLLVFHGVASFELRTRGGLYAGLGLVGIVFLLLAQHAAGYSYGLFLMGYTVLAVAFLALSYLTDGLRSARVVWFRRRYAFGLVWAAVFAALLSLSTLAFLVIPKDLRDPLENAQASVLALRAGAPTTEAVPVPAFEEVMTALPDAARETEAGDQSDAPQRADDAQASPASPKGKEEAVASQGPDALMPGADAPRPSEGGGSQPSEVPDDAVAFQVRSPVASYWRQEAYDVFDGRRWGSDSSFALPSAETEAARDLGPAVAGLLERPRYSQTFYLRRDGGREAPVSGYWALRSAFPRQGDAEGPGAVYRVISALPDYSPESLSDARRGREAPSRYLTLPPDSEAIARLAQEVVDGAIGDFDRVRRIVAFLDRNYAFDAEAPDQLTLTAPPRRFLRERTPGTSMDFATATTLMARAVGVPARVVTGYLPGRYDPLTGSYVVRRQDRHAWTEVYMEGAGWVPVDASPRPELAALGEGGSTMPAAVRRLVSLDLGRGASRALGDASRRWTGWLSSLVDGGRALLTAGGLLVALPALVGLWRWHRGGRRHRSAYPGYSALEGHARRRFLRLYRRAEGLLARAGLGRRPPHETLSEFLGRLGTPEAVEDLIGDLDWLRREAWRAAYDPAPYSSPSLEEAQRRLGHLRRALRARRRR